MILTNIALEHTEFLGDTEAAIAGEKLAVCPDGSDRLVVGRLSPPARAAVDDELARRGIRALRYGEGLTARDEGGTVVVETPVARYEGLPLALRGGFQRDNLALAVAGAELVIGGPLAVEPLREAVAAVRMPGRLEVVPGAPEVVLDGAHNPAGVEALVAELDGARSGRGPVVAVVSALEYKDVEGMVAALAPAVGAGGGDALVAPARGGPRPPGGAGARGGPPRGRRRGAGRRAGAGPRGGRTRRDRPGRGIAVFARRSAAACTGGRAGTPC